MAAKLDPRFVRRGLILVFITLLLDIIGIAIIVPIMPQYLSELTGDTISGASLDGSYLFIAYALMQFLFAPFIGNLSDRFGRRPILLVSIITFALDNLICAIAWSFWMLFAGRILAGISGASFSTCSAYIADISDDTNRTRNFGLIGIAFGAGFVLGPFIGGLLGEISPRLPFYVAAGLSFVNFIFACFFLPETLSKRNRRRFNIFQANPFGALLHLRKYPAVIWVCVAFFFIGFHKLFGQLHGLLLLKKDIAGVSSLSVFHLVHLVLGKLLSWQLYYPFLPKGGQIGAFQ